MATLTPEQLQANTLANNKANPLYGSNPIPSSQIQPTNPIDVGSTITTPTDNGNGMATGASTFATNSNNQLQQDYQQNLDFQNSQPKSDLSNTFDSYLKQVSTAAEGLQGRGAAQTQAEQQTGANTFNTQLKDVNAQILAKTAARDKAIADAELTAGKTGQTWNMFLGTQGAINRGSAAEIGLLQAQALGLQGQAQEAQRQADRAVDLMYQDKEDAYNTKLKQLELIQGQLTKEEAKQAKAQEYALNKQKDKLAEEKQTRKDILALGLTVSKNQPPQGIINQINAAKTYEEAINIAAPYMTSPADKLDLQLKRLQIQKAKNDLNPKADSQKLLSIDEAQKLGVPYGTTQGQAIALQGKVPTTELQLQTFNNAQELLNKFDAGLKGLGGNVPVGGGNFGFKLPGSKRADFVAVETSLKNQLTLDNLKYLKGPTSDKDIAFITSASSSLNRNTSTAQYRKTLTAIRDTLAKYSPEYQYSNAATNLIQPEDPYSSYTSNVLTQ